MRHRRPRRTRSASSAASVPHLLGTGRSGARLIAFALVALSLWLLVHFIGQVVDGARMDRQIADKQAEIARIEDGNAALKQQVVSAESPAHIEQIAREQLGYAREGDTVILPTLPERTAPPDAHPSTRLPAAAAEPNWRGWFHAFFPPPQAP
jgi:cell division protein FtsB